MTTHRKRPANQKGGKGGSSRPARAPRAAAPGGVPAPGAAVRPEPLELAVDLDAIEFDLDPVAAAAPERPAAPARAKVVVADSLAPVAGYASAAAVDAPAARGVLPARARGRTTPKVYALTREQEYAFIEEDMRRLLAIAGILLVLMLALLFILER